MTYYRDKRDRQQGQKRPTIEAKETYYRTKETYYDFEEGIPA